VISQRQAAAYLSDSGGAPVHGLLTIQEIAETNDVVVAEVSEPVGPVTTSLEAGIPEELNEGLVAPSLVEKQRHNIEEILPPVETINTVTSVSEVIHCY